MNGPINGIDLLVVIIVLALLVGAYSYGSWLAFDEQRRMKRLRDRGMA